LGLWATRQHFPIGQYTYSCFSGPFFPIEDLDYLEQGLWLGHGLTPLALALIASGVGVLYHQRRCPDAPATRHARRLLGRVVLALGVAAASQSTLALAWVGDQFALGMLSWTLRNAALLSALLYGAGLGALGMRRLTARREPAWSTAAARVTAVLLTGLPVFVMMKFPAIHWLINTPSTASPDEMLWEWEPPPNRFGPRAGVIDVTYTHGPGGDPGY